MQGDLLWRCKATTTLTPSRRVDPEPIRLPNLTTCYLCTHLSLSLSLHASQVLASLHAQPGDLGEVCAFLDGQTTASVGIAGVVGFDELVLREATGQRTLCAGEYTLRFALAPSPHADDVAPRANAQQTLTADVRVRLVSTGEAPPRHTHWSVEIPPFYNLSDGSVLVSTITYEQYASRSTIRTKVTTNTSKLLPVPDLSNASSAPDSSVANSTAPIGGYVVVSSALRVSSHERAPTHVMVFTQPPPSEIRTREPFNVSLHVATESGVPLPAQQVQGLLLARFGSGARLAPGAVGYTDAFGDVTIELSVEAGESGDYLLLFGSEGTMQQELKRDIGIVLSAVQSALRTWQKVIVPIAQGAVDLAAAARDGRLADLLAERASGAVQAEVQRALQEVTSCIALANYVQRNVNEQQSGTVTLNLTGTPTEAFYGGGLPAADIFAQAEFLDPANVAAEAPAAVACQAQVVVAAEQAGIAYSDPDAFAELISYVIVRIIIRSLGLDQLAPFLAASPALAAQVVALEQKIQLLFDAADVLLTDDGEVDWQQVREMARSRAVGVSLGLVRER